MRNKNCQIWNKDRKMTKQIKKTVVNGIKVSTIQLPNDPFYRGFYETIVLSHGHEFERRSGTYNQAMNDHAAGIEYAKGLK
jgi:hypothetical protein